MFQNNGAGWSMDVRLALTSDKRLLSPGWEWCKNRQPRHVANDIKSIYVDLKHTSYNSVAFP